MRTLHLMDVTVKEGGFRVHHRVLPEQVATIAHGLKSAGLQNMEVSHGCGAGSFRQGYPGLYNDQELLTAARDAAPEMEFCAHFAPSFHALHEIDALQGMISMGRVWVNVDDVLPGKEHIKKLKSYGKKAIGLIQRIHVRPYEEAISAARQLQDLGADVIYLADTFGSLGPDEVRRYVEGVRSEIGAEIGFQARNHTGRAVANTLAAWDAGAEWLDASLLGLGSGGGMAPLEILVAIFQKQGLLEGINLLELTYTAKWQAYPAFHSLPRTQLVDLLLSQLRMDYYPADLLVRIADVLGISLGEFLSGLKNSRPEMVQLKEADLRAYLEKENLSLDVVLEYFRTGKISSQENSEPE